jgi:hypothetical protein
MPSNASKKRTNKKKRPREIVAPLYTEDIGTDGLKKSSFAPSKNLTYFNLTVDGKEKTKRQKRMVRSTENA